MRLLKVTVWVTNLLIASVIIGAIYLFTFAKIFMGDFEPPESRNLTGATGMSEIRTFNNQFYDLQYFFIYRNAETLIDDFMISTKHLILAYDYAQASDEGFMALTVNGETQYVPAMSEKLYLKVASDEKNRYYYLTMVYLMEVALFVVLVLIWFRSILQRFSKGDFFHKKNRINLFRIGVAFPVHAFLVYGYNRYFTNSLLPENLELPVGYRLIDQTPGVNWGMVLIGVMILFLALSFREGIKLKEEQSLTI